MGPIIWILICQLFVAGIGHPIYAPNLTISRVNYSQSETTSNYAPKNSVSPSKYISGHPGGSYQRNPSETYHRDPSESYHIDPGETYQRNSSESYQRNPSELYQRNPSKSYQRDPSESYQRNPNETYQRTSIYTLNYTQSLVICNFTDITNIISVEEIPPSELRLVGNFTILSKVVIEINARSPKLNSEMDMCFKINDAKHNNGQRCMFFLSRKKSNIECLTNKLYFKNDFLCGSTPHLSTFGILLINDHNLRENNYDFVYAAVAVFGLVLCLSILIVISERIFKPCRKVILGEVGMKNYTFRHDLAKIKKQPVAKKG